MITRRSLALLALFLALATPAFPQTATVRIGWDQGNPLVDAQSFTYAIKVNTSTPTLAPATCVAAPIGASCTTPAPAGLKPGDSLVLIATNGITTATSLPFVIPTGPVTPTLVKMVVTYTIP